MSQTLKALFCTSIALWFAAAVAQNTPGPMASASAAKATTATQSTSTDLAGVLHLQLIAQPREVEIPSRFNLALKLINSSSQTVTFRAFKLKTLEDAGGLKVVDECSKQSQRSIPPGESNIIVCEIKSDGFEDSLPSFLVALVQSWSLLTLQPGEYRFVGMAEVRTTSSIAFVTETVLVKIRPTVWQVCFGALLGAGMLVIFALCSGPLRKKIFEQGRNRDVGRLQKWLIEPLVLWIGATISASMFIFMTYRMKDVTGPFTLSVNDFYGGVVIGLFGVFLADWLAEKLFKQKE